jgi:two-component system, sensor histidine kinase and response regulator
VIRVVLVDDQALIRTGIRALLDAEDDIEVVAEGADGREGLALAAEHRPDIVLMDVQMPEMGGLEAARAIRARERATGGHLPIVATTAHAMRGDRERCLEAGMDEYLTKPLHPDELHRVLGRLSGAAPSPKLVTERAGASEYDTVLERIGGDKVFLSEISALFNEDLPRHLAAIQRTLEARDGEGLQRAAHVLKGAAANFEASALVAAARSLEEMGRTAQFADADRIWPTLVAEATTFSAVLATYALTPSPPAEPR